MVNMHHKIPHVEIAQRTDSGGLVPGTLPRYPLLAPGPRGELVLGKDQQPGFRQIEPLAEFAGDYAQYAGRGEAVGKIPQTHINLGLFQRGQDVLAPPLAGHEDAVVVGLAEARQIAPEDIHLPEVVRRGTVQYGDLLVNPKA